MNEKPESLPQAWRERAEQLREWGGSPDAARLWDHAATELEQALTAVGNDTVSLTEAARLTGLSAGHLGDLVRAGKIANARRKHAPKIRRSDLPAAAVPERAPRRPALKQGDLSRIIRRRRSS